MKNPFSTNDHETAVITPTRGKNDPQLGPDSLMVMIPSEVKHLVSISGAKRITISDMSMGRLFVVENLKKGPVAISGPFLGAPQAVLAMEKLIALGARRIWVMGWCGSISKNLSIGSMFVPTWSVSEEGTSQHYPVSQAPPRPDENLTATLLQFLRDKGVSVAQGPIWTTDAPYRETRGKIRKFQDSGVLAVDMEMSALMTVAMYRSVAMTALLVVSDELFNLVWKTGFSDSLLKKNSRFAAEILLKIAMEYS